MNNQDRIDVEIFKVVSKAIATSDNIELMTNHLCQLLVVTLEIKGSSIFLFTSEL